MILSEFDQIIKEYFDLSDKYTRQYIVGLDEDGNEEVLAALSAKLYDNIVAKAGEIDFGTIPKSRGDITKVEKFNITLESIDIVRRLVVEYNENPAQVDTIISAIENIKDFKPLFMKAYALDVELPMLIYNLMTLAVVRSTSLIIATCVTYIADPSNKNIKMAFDKEAYKDTESDVMYQQLVTFNSLCKDGSLYKLLNSVIQNNKNKTAYKEDFNFSAINNPGYNDIGVNPVNYDADSVDAPMDTDTDPMIYDGPSAVSGPDSAMSTPAEQEVDDPFVKSAAPSVGGTAPSVVPNWSRPINHDDGYNNELPTQDSDVPSYPDAADPVHQPVIPENRMATTGTVRPAVQSETVRDIETDSTFEKELSGAKKSPIDDEESDALRSGKVKYNSEYKEAVKQKILAVKERSEDEPIGDKDADKLRAGKEKYDSKNMEGVKQQVVGKGLTEAKISGSNVTAKAGDVVKYMKSSALGKAAIGAAIIIGAINVAKISFTLFIRVIIPWIRSTIYNFYYQKMKFAEYLQIQAELIEANATELENTTASDENRKKEVVRKQRKVAEFLRSMANKFNIDRQVASKKAEEDMKKDDKEKHKVDKNDSGDDVLF